jgi:hypothetical protein
MEVKEWADATILLQPLAIALKNVRVVFTTTGHCFLCANARIGHWKTKLHHKRLYVNR